MRSDYCPAVGEPCQSMCLNDCCLKAGAKNAGLEAQLRAQHDLIQKLKAALEECVEDSEAAIVDHLQKYGQQYKAQRVVAMRKQVSDARAALAAAEAHK